MQTPSTDTPSPITVYGIKSCDTMKKAMVWLTDQGIPFEFHDYKKAGIDQSSLKTWLATAGADKIINRRGTTWRKLSDPAKAVCNSQDPDAIAQVLAAHTSVIKRPVVTVPGFDAPLVGFNPDEWSTAFK